MSETETELLKLPMLVIFNRVNGEHLWNVSKTDYAPEYDQNLFIVREAEMSPVEDDVIGKIIVYDDGTLKDDWQVVKRSEQPEVITERNLNMTAEQKITKKYPIVDQINILSRAIKLLGDKTGVELEELDEMLSYIKLTTDINRTQKDFYREQSSVRYLSDEEIAEESSRKMEGGVHEWIGPRPVTGGRVFGTGE